MENASAAFLDALRKFMTAIGVAVGTATIDPNWLACAKRLQYNGYGRCTATAKAILTLSRQGMPIRQIICTTGHNRKHVRRVLRWRSDD
jgi:hypothetical protein